MTVTYSSQVATSNFSCFLRLLFRWRGSIYKLVWRDFAAFATVYYMLSFIYRFMLPEQGKRYFEGIAEYCEKFNNLIPVAFILGFYVSLVVSRFWEQLSSIPWPHRLALFVSTLVHGIDDRGRLMRRTIMRYLSLAYVLTMRAICPPVRKRFPTMQHITDAGIMLENEQSILASMESSQLNVYFVPLVWAAGLVNRARKEGRVKDDFAVKTLIDEINAYRGSCGVLFCYDWVTVPLVYTQVVTLAVYMFFLSCLMGRQFLENGHEGDMYFPLFTFLQFFFYMGWLKVAESLLNPFGEDDDDFDINGLVDSNLQAAYVIVDEMYEKLPELLEDKYWDTMDIVMPYTAAAEPYRTEAFQGSAVNVQVPAAKSQFIAESVIPPSILEEEGAKLLNDRSEKVEIDGPKHMYKRQPSSKIGSLLSVRNLFTRSVSRTSQPPSDSDAESTGVATPNHIRMTNIRHHRDKIPASLTSCQEETQFELQMSDDEDQRSIPGSVLTVINEMTPTSPLPFGTEPPFPTRRTSFAQSVRPGEEPASPVPGGSRQVPLDRGESIEQPDSAAPGRFQPGESYLGRSVQQAFVDQVREQLRELRERDVASSPAN